MGDDLTSLEEIILTEIRDLIAAGRNSYYIRTDGKPTINRQLASSAKASQSPRRL